MFRFYFTKIWVYIFEVGHSERVKESTDFLVSRTHSFVSEQYLC